ncbi:phage tail protein, partial [Photobacterium damselae subsp. damselae]|uniref:host specificity factor TipJ family phage tail protein n=1 Tax=Photobacterium damselae TaxID=38293 RepID=UPI000D06665C
MPHIVQFHHPIRKDDYTLHSVESGTCLSQWLSENLPAAGKLKATCNFKELEDFNHIIGENDVVSIRPALGFGIDWVIWAALAVSVASAVYMYSQMPDLSSNADTQQASSVYNYNGQGNKPKLGNPVPVQYGRMPHYPDIISPNWWEYVDNEQYYYQTFSKGIGKFAIHEHYIGETPITQYGDDIEIRVHQPGELVNHFAHIVWTSKEVGSSDGQGGLKLEGVTSDWVAEATSQEVRFRGRIAELWNQHHSGGGSSNSGGWYWRKSEWPWQAGQHIVITSTTQSAQMFEGNLHFHDMGDDGDLLFPDDLPDQIENPIGWGELKVGQRLIITGAGTNSGTFIVSKILAGNRIEVNNDSGHAITNFDPMSNVFCRVSEATTNDGTYVCKDASGTLALVNSDDLTEVSGWAGFIEMDSPTALLSVLERDVEAKWIGNFLSVPSDATALDVGVDFIFPRGLGEMNNDGDIVNREVVWEVRARPAGTNSVYRYHELKLNKADNTPQRVTFWLKKEMSLPSGRYEIGCRRKTSVVDSTRMFDEIQWMGLKSIIQHDYSNNNETIITLKIKATNALSTQANQQYWCDSTRIVPVRQLNGSYLEQATRSIADAVIDACRDSVYGAALVDDAIDLDTLIAYRSKWDSRGDTCDGLFDQPTAFWDALGKLLQTGRAYPRIDFGSVSMWRDEPRVALCKPYSPVNMTPDSFSADIRLLEDDDYDGVEVEWFNPESRKSETLLCTVPGQDG